MTCPCGKEYEGDMVMEHKVNYFNKEGKIVFAICLHEVVIIDAEKDYDNKKVSA